MFFAQGVSHQGTLAPKATFFGYVSFPIRLQDSDQRYHWKKSILIFDFLLGDNHQGKIAYNTPLLGRVWPGVTTGSIGFNHSLIINISWWNQFIPLHNHCHLIFLFCLFPWIFYLA